MEAEVSMREIRQGQFYRHFKNHLYQIMAVAQHSETGEKMVVYQALYGDYRIYVRPYEMFISEVDHKKYPEVTQKYRFELVNMEGTGDNTEQARSVEQLYGKAEAQYLENLTEKQEEHLRNAEAEEEDYAEGEVNPILLEFLDAETLEEKMHLMVYHRNRMDENLLNNIAISLDLVVEKKTIQEKYDEILNCLSMMRRFECNRFR